MTMLSLLACALAFQAPVGQPPRLRTILENGSVVMVERMPQERAVVLDLWVSAASFPETPLHNGVRHLMEHFLARGLMGDLDQRLESAGGFLRASTYRDAIQFEVTVPRDRLALGLAAVQEVMSLKAVSREEIEREAGTMRREAELRHGSALDSSQAWDAVFEGQAPDPFGNLDVIAATTPATLGAAHQGTFRGAGVALVIAGDVDLDLATKQAKDVLSVLPKGEPRTLPDRAPKVRKVARDSWRAVAVGGYREPSTAAALMAGLAIASEADEPYFVYTPSLGPGVMIVGGEGLDKVDSRGLFETGKQLAQRWVLSQLDDARGVGYLRGLLLCQAPALRPETLLENIETVSSSAFYEAVAQYGVAK